MRGNGFIFINIFIFHAHYISALDTKTELFRTLRKPYFGQILLCSRFQRNDNSIAVPLDFRAESVRILKFCQIQNNQDSSKKT